MDSLTKIRRICTSILIAATALWFFLLPGYIVATVVRDPGLRTPAVPRCAFSWHRSLTPRIGRWAEERVSSGRAAKISPNDITSTEWPIFGTVFYLMATENLQAACDQDPSLTSDPPVRYARGAIGACAALVADPSHAAWVQAKWGEDYLHRENVFYRYLLIFGFTAYERLTGDSRYRRILKDQVDTLSEEFSQAPHFVLDDYPNECYPADVLWAVAAIRRADPVLGTNHEDLVKKAFDHFKPPLVDPLGLIPYSADSQKGVARGSSRGCGNSAVLIFAPELDARTAREWYGTYERHFWQRVWLFDGFREFPAGSGKDLFWDVDSGPVVLGHGVAACAFGVGAARANGRFDHAYTLAAESIVFSWPLPDGTLLIPRILSNASEAPCLGEAGMLFNLTRTPSPYARIVPAKSLSPLFWILLCGYFAFGSGLVWSEVRRWRRWRNEEVLHPRAAFAAWAVCLGAAVILALCGFWGSTVLPLLLSLSMPEWIAGRTKTPASRA